MNKTMIYFFLSNLCRDLGFETEDLIEKAQILYVSDCLDAKMFETKQEEQLDCSQATWKEIYEYTDKMYQFLKEKIDILIERRSSDEKVE